MGVLNFYLSLSCLLAVTHGSPSDCVGEPQGVLPDPATVSGLWNLFAVSLSPNSKYQTDEIAYVYAKVSFNETASSVAVFSNPMSDTNGQLFQHERIPGTQTYKYIPTEALEDVYTTTVFQPHPDILICYERLNNEINGAYLHSRAASIPKEVLDNFFEWSKCNDLINITVYNHTLNDAQECYGLFEHSEDLKDIEGCETWGLVAKASNYADRNYHIRLLYSAKLELCKTEEAYTFKEIQIAGDEKILMELKFENRTTGDKLKLQSFKTGTDMLLLGVQNEKQSTLFLASKTSKVKQTILDEFAMEAHCFEATFTYLVPGSKEEESHAENQ
ncbi:uncharacterized protein LOC121397774 isoform X1 [Xenopus laevis]|uniref:Uncharacterized protein LOC121397774 isoform X1 n=1 Tax=Xenopus laevis TaxID=8355 RepID=A0A8J1LPY8_XENLA|nr:uncharacterized protein LOC121397774 isoform X1 [Xenopus laevis]